MQHPHPILLLITEVIIISFITGFTAPLSILRVAALPLVALCVCIAIPACHTRVQRSPWGALVGGYSITVLFQYISVALLSRWSFEGRGLLIVSADSKAQDSKTNRSEGCERKIQVWKTQKDRKKDVELRNSIWARVKFGFLIATAFRFTDTPYEVKNVPRFSSRDPDYIPSRREFLRQRVVIALACYLVLDLFGLFSSSAANATNFSPEMVPIFARLDQVSGQEVIKRLVATLGAGFGAYCVQLGVQSVVAFLDVGLGMSDVQHWRPLFGSPKEAYTVRRFWGQVWHQNNRHMISKLVDFLLHRLLCLPRRTWLIQRLNLFLNFFISGLLHAVVDMASGLSWHETGALQFFCTQFIGIALEGIAQTIYHRAIQRANHPPAPSPSAGAFRLTVLIGYIWVIIFITWSFPVWAYPALHKSRGGMEDSLLPFSILARFVNQG